MSEGRLGLLWDARRARKGGTDGLLRRQRARLGEMIAFARAESPFYRSLYGRLRTDVHDLSTLPVTDKPSLMAHFDKWCTDRAVTLAGVRTFVDDPAAIGEWFLDRYTVATTSGTTGLAGIFLMDRRSMAVTTAMAGRMLGAWLSAKDLFHIAQGRARLAMVNATDGHFASAVAATRLRRRRRDRVEVLPVRLPLAEMVERLNRFRPVVLAPYASVGSLLAIEQEEGRLHIDPALIVLSAEGLPEAEYGRIGRAFGGKVRHSYAATECPFLSYSCAEGWLHVNADWVVIEPVDIDYQPVPAGERSHTVLVSNLANRVQPILRYDLGDSVIVRPDPCSCGDPLPAIRVEGRAADLLQFRTSMGDLIAVAPLGLLTAIDQAPGVSQAQIVQDGPSSIRVRLSFTAEAQEDRAWTTVRNLAREYLGQQGLTNVRVERADEAPQQTSGGKFRAVIPYAHPRDSAQTP